MTDMRDKELLVERPKTRPPAVAPPKAKPVKPAPPRLFRWIEWMAVVVAAAALVAGAIWLIGRGGDDEAVVPYHAEHGEFTSLAVRDVSDIDFRVRMAGLDANLDRDVVAFPEFTAMPDTYARHTLDIDRFVGADANLDRDVVAFPEFTPMPDSYSWHLGVPVGVARLSGLDANLDPDG